MMAGTGLAPAKVALECESLSVTPPGRANPASPRAEIAALFCRGGLLEKKELETLRSEADDSPSEPDGQPLQLQVSNSSL